MDKTRVLRLGLVLAAVWWATACGSAKRPDDTGKPEAFQLAVEHKENLGFHPACYALWTGGAGLAAVASAKGETRILTLRPLRVIAKFTLDGGRPRALAFTKGGAVLAVAWRDGRLTAHSAADGKTIAAPAFDKVRDARTLASHQGTGILVAATAKGVLHAFGPDLSAAFQKDTEYPGLAFLAFNRQGNVLVYASDRNDFSLFNLATLGAVKRIATEGRVLSCAFSADGFLLAVGTLFWKTLVYDTRTFRTVATKELDLTPARSSAFHPLSGELVVGAGGLGDGTLTSWQGTAFAVRKSAVLPSREARLLGFLEQPARLAVLAADGKVLIVK